MGAGRGVSAYGGRWSLFSGQNYLLDRAPMSILVPSFKLLESDEVLLEGNLASDVRSLWRRLSRTSAVQTVARDLASDPERIRALTRALSDLLKAPYDPLYR